MRTIKNLVENTEKRVYVFLVDTETQERFAADAEREGITLGDGTKISDRPISDFYAINADGTVNFINTVGRIAFQSGAENIVRIDYKKYCNGDEDFLYYK